jgi:hypothetical protein
MKKEFPSILQFITVCDYTNPYTESMVLDPPVLMMALGHGVPVCVHLSMLFCHCLFLQL